MSGEKRGTVWIASVDLPERAPPGTPIWEANWETGSDREEDEHHEFLWLSDAVEWSRERADRVIVRLMDSGEEMWAGKGVPPSNCTMALTPHRMRPKHHNDTG